MRKLITFVFKVIRKIYNILRLLINKLITRFLFYVNHVDYKQFYTNGIPFLNIIPGGKFVIMNNFKMNNGNLGNPIGRPQKCTFVVASNGELIIGENVGISSTAIVAHSNIKIGNNVKIGGGVCIYDTDFHSLDPDLRKNRGTDISNKNNKPVTIGDNVFVGAHSTILKGVRIGDNSIIGACSVVARDIPENEIWAGNPAKFIKKLQLNV